MWWSRCIWTWVVVALWMVGVEADYSLATGETPEPRGPSDSSRLQDIKREFLNVVGNSSSSAESMSAVLTLLHSNTGQQLGRLLLEGVMLGVKEKDSLVTLSLFWEDLQERLSPHLLEQLDDYRDFFRGMDLSTVPLMWEKMFEKDDLGNSLAGIPLGQLVAMVQPTASRYGIDIRSFINSLMGLGEDNARDLLLEALNGFDWSSLFSSLFNSTAAPSTSLIDKPVSNISNTKNTKTDNRVKKGKNDKTLRLFRPLISSMLRENDIDLDADAVLEVVAPLLSGDFMAQVAPLLAALASQSGGSLKPIIANIMGNKEGQEKQKIGGLLGGLQALLGGNNQMDLGAMMNIASLFMDSDKPIKKNKRQSEKKKDEVKEGLDMNKIINLASKLAETNNINIDSVLKATSSFLNPEKKDKVTTKTESKSSLSSPVSKKPKSSLTKKSPRHLIDILEPILLTMQTDKKCNRKIKDAILFGKTMLNKKVSKLGDLNQLLPLLTSSLMSEEFMTSRGLNVDAIVATFKNAMMYTSLEDVLFDLASEDFREILVRTVTPHVTELFSLLSSQAVKDKIYEFSVSRIQDFFASYGLPGISLTNFPERLAPMVGLLGKGWNLPFNPTTVLVPLRDYLRHTIQWATNGLEHISTLQSHQIEEEVSASLKEACRGVVAGVRLTQDAKVECLKERLCHAAREQRLNTIGAGIMRTTSLMLAAGPVLETSDSTKLVKIVQAISGSIEDCQETLPEECGMEEVEENHMKLDYEHEEL